MMKKSTIRLLLVAGCLICVLYTAYVYQAAKAISRSNIINYLIAARLADPMDNFIFFEKSPGAYFKHTILLIKGTNFEQRLESIGLEPLDLASVENTSTMELVNATQAKMGLKQSSKGFRLHLDELMAHTIITLASNQEALIFIIY